MPPGLSGLWVPRFDKIEQIDTAAELRRSLRLTGISHERITLRYKERLVGSRRERVASCGQQTAQASKVATLAREPNSWLRQRSTAPGNSNLDPHT